MVTNSRQIKMQRASLSAGMLSSAHGLLVMDVMLMKQQLQNRTVLGAARLEYWHALLEHVHPAPAFYGEIAVDSESRGGSGVPSGPTLAKFPTPRARNALSANPPDGGSGAVVKRVVSSVLGGSVLDPALPLVSHGLDSLAALELRQAIQVMLCRFTR